MIIRRPVALIWARIGQGKEGRRKLCEAVTHRQLFHQLRHASGSQTPQPVEIFKQLTAHPSASEGGLSIATAATNSAVVAAKQFSRVRSKQHLACSSGEIRIRPSLSLMLSPRGKILSVSRLRCFSASRGVTFRASILALVSGSQVKTSPPRENSREGAISIRRCWLPSLLRALWPESTTLKHSLTFLCFPYYSWCDGLLRRAEVHQVLLSGGHHQLIPPSGTPVAPGSQPGQSRGGVAAPFATPRLGLGVRAAVAGPRARGQPALLPPYPPQSLR